MFRTSSLIFMAAVLIFCIAGRICLQILYRRGVRRYERSMKASYAARFEERASVAKSLNAHLNEVIQRSKTMVNHMRESPVDTYTTYKGLHQVSDWLKIAEEESDTALRSLEAPLERKSDHR